MFDERMTNLIKETTINEGTITLSYNNYGYQKVLNDFPSAKEIIIVTFNISKNDTILLEELKKLDESVSVTFITNLPQRHEIYYKSYQRKTPADRALENIKDYFNQLDREQYKCDLTVYFCYENHAKIILTENIAYIGSSNFSDESKNNLEAGIIINNEDDIKGLRDKIVPGILAHSVRYTTSLYTIYTEYATDWLKGCYDFFEHLDMGIFTYGEIGYLNEEKILDLNNAFISFEKLSHFTDMMYKAEELIDAIIYEDEFAEKIGENSVNKISRLIGLLKYHVNKLERLLEELADFDFKDLQMDYAQDMPEYHSGDPDDLNYAFEQAQSRAQEDFEKITKRFIGLEGYLERVQKRVPKLLQLIIDKIQGISHVLKSESVYENKSQINNTDKRL